MTRSLFLKIFLWFWTTVLVTAIALVMTFIFGPGRVSSRWHSALTNTARSSGMIVVEELERGGPAAASSYIQSFERDTQLRACLFNVDGTRVVGSDCNTFADLRSRATTSRGPEFGIRYGFVRVALLLTGRSGHDYIFATELPAGPRAALGMDKGAMALRLVVAFSVSGFVCYLLTAYLTGPILRLREVAQQLAQGQLSARASITTKRPGDELDALARDFNTMADRIEQLLSRLRQLIFDISHELRSPLARLNVALDLARDGKTGQLPFDHMERDLARLDEMLERLLTLAKLDSTSTQVTMTSLDIAEIVGRIAADAAFEAQKRNVVVVFAAQAHQHIRGNAELLHSAIENVVRNAVRYTEEGTAVEISLTLHDESRLLLEVRDHGSGIPEEDLERIFQAFHRVAEARERKSGGVGLGLAIADRVVRLHGGAIRAENVQPGGLKVSIELPVPTR